VKVRIQALDQQNIFAKAGLMARAGLGASAQYAGLLMMPIDKGFRFQSRATDAAITNVTSTTATAFVPDSWVRLKRQGDVFTGYTSTDGVNWTQVKSLTLVLPQTLYLGLAVTSHNPNGPTTAQFRDLGNV